MPNSNVRLEEHYSKEVWTNPHTDPLRREACLCLNCERKELWGCATANELYIICCQNNLALMVTRCPYYITKDNEQTTQDAGES